MNAEFADWSPSGHRPSNQANWLGLWVVSTLSTCPVGCHHLHPPLPVIVFTQPEGKTQFTIPQRTKGWVKNHHTAANLTNLSPYSLLLFYIAHDCVEFLNEWMNEWMNEYWINEWMLFAPGVSTTYIDPLFRVFCITVGTSAPLSISRCLPVNLQEDDDLPDDRLHNRHVGVTRCTGQTAAVQLWTSIKWLSKRCFFAAISLSAVSGCRYILTIAYWCRGCHYEH